ncbi:hypothetical protein BH10PLA2_BH10PLA2_04370 [soil metagenome]
MTEALEQEEAAAEALMGKIVDEFLARTERGERPEADEYVRRHPQLADVLRQMLPALALLRESGVEHSAEAADSAEMIIPEGALGDYRLVREIGLGGMGIVYEAVQISLGRRVAVKVLPFASALDAKQLQRFKNEAQAAAHLHHNNIVPVHGVGCDRGVHYYAMQFVDGQNLAALIRDLRQFAGLVDDSASLVTAEVSAGPLTSGCLAPVKHKSEDALLIAPSIPSGLKPSAPTVSADTASLAAAAVSTQNSTRTPAFFRSAANLGVRAAQALEHAHGQGIVHRDVKPANLLVDGRGNLWITDFGLAHCQSQGALTMTGDLIGTLRYMSPEQALAQKVAIDHRTDIYSLGATLYELLTLEPLFHGRDRQELLRQIAFEEPTSPRRLNNAIPAELETIVLKSLEKNPADRYATAQELADDLERFLKDESIRAKRPSLLERARKWVRRHQGVVRTALIAQAVFLITIAVGASLAGWGLHREQMATRDQLRLTEEAQEQATSQLFSALLAQARAGRLSRQMGQRFDSLAALEKAARIRPDERLRDEAIAALALPDIRRGASLHAMPVGTKFDAFDDLYKSYARIDDLGIVSIRGIPSDAEIRRIETKTTATAMRLSPDGQVLAVLDDRSAVHLWRIADGKSLQREAPRPCSTMAFSPDSRQLALAKQDLVLAIDLASGQETRRWRLRGKAHAMAFHPDNRRLAVSYAENKVASVYDSTQGSHVADLPVGLMGQPVLAWHPDGARLALAGSDPRIQIWDAGTQRKLATLEGHVEQVTALSFYPQGDLLASSSWDGTLRLWEPGTGRQLMQLPLAAVPQFSRTGQLGYLWQGGEHVQLLEATPSREYRTIVSRLGAGRGSYYHGDISPDGRLLALGMSDGGDRLWELSSGRELALLPSTSQSVLFESGGGALLTCGPTGVQRWSIQANEATDRELRLGPPAQIALPITPHRAARNLSRLAVVSENEGAVLLLDLRTASISGPHFAHPKASGAALSLDERWLATCGWHSDRVRLWNASTGAMVHEWVLGALNAVFFTPDSRALIICRGDAFTFWDVETLQPIRRLARDIALYPGYVAFSPDGALMALEMGPAIIHLMEVATGRTVAKLEDPHGDRAGWMGFTPDGAQLVTAATYAKAIHVWDLRAIRQQLKVMGLDWDWPEFQRPEGQTRTRELTNIEVLTRGMAQPRRSREEIARQAIEQYRRDVEATPNDARACNNLAWVYLTAPPALRDVKAALPLAENAVRLAAGSTTYLNTLGLAYYRAGRYREAVAILRPNFDKQDDQELGFDLYFLAMSHHRLGETARARDYLTWAVRWTKSQQGPGAAQKEELKQLRAEAEELLLGHNGQ